MENILDIMEEKKAEESIRLLSDAVERATDAIIITNLEGNITFVNDSCAKICGYDKSEMIGQHISLIHYANQHDASFKSPLASLKKTGACTGEISACKKTGEVFLAILSVSIIKDESGIPMAVLVIGRDITEQKRICPA